MFVDPRTDVLYAEPDKALPCPSEKDVPEEPQEVAVEQRVLVRLASEDEVEHEAEEQEHSKLELHRKNTEGNVLIRKPAVDHAEQPRDKEVTDSNRAIYVFHFLSYFIAGLLLSAPHRSFDQIELVSKPDRHGTQEQWDEPQQDMSVFECGLSRAFFMKHLKLV